MLEAKELRTVGRRVRDITKITVIPYPVRNYGWVVRPFKKVTLVNVNRCMRNIMLEGVHPNWRTGHAQWDAMLSGWFMKRVTDSAMNSEDEADISILFNRDLLACGNKRMSQEEIYELLIDSFKIVDENEYELKLAMVC